MILGAEIGLLVFAIITLVRGKLVLTKNRVVVGWKARVLAVFGLLPIPLSLLIAVVLAVVLAAGGQPVQPGTTVKVVGTVVEIGIILLCVAAVYAIGLPLAGPPEPAPPRRQRLSDDEDAEPASMPEAAPTGIKPGDPRPVHVSTTAPTAAPRHTESEGEEPALARPEVGRSASRYWIVGLAAAGALGVCCLGVALVGVGVAAWRFRAQPGHPERVDVAKAPQDATKGPDAKAPPPEPVRPPLKLPPIPELQPIPPSQVKAKMTVALPARATRVVVGGGGRFLLLYFPSMNQAGRFDVVTGKLTVSFPTLRDTELAAGANKIMTWSPQFNQLVRCDLATGNQERLFGLKLNGKVTAFCMGSASNGPLLISTDKEVIQLIDVEDGSPMPLPNDEQGRPLTNLSNGMFWAAGTGRLFGRMGLGGMPNGILSLKLEPDRAVVHSRHEGTFFVVPDADGQHIYSGGHGVLTSDLQIVPNAAYSAVNNANAKHLYLPACQGPYYFHMHAGLDPGPNQGGERGIRIYKLGNPKPILVVPDAGTPTFAEMQASRDLRLEDMVHLIPPAKLLITLPKEGDRLLLHPVDW
jgi:hypothetical protein